MNDEEISSFVADLARLGTRLTALQLADGKLKVYRWRMQGASTNRLEIEVLWKSKIGQDQSRIDALARHILRTEQGRYEASGRYVANDQPHK
jgi:hypothetical protein